jgi:hypothetical protein
MNDKNRRAVELVLELHKMIDAGRGDSDQADQIREELDDYYKTNEQLLIKTLNNLSGLLNDDRNTRKGIGQDVELVSGTVRVPIELPVDQYLYLRDLADDLRGSLSEAVRVYVKEGMEASTKGGAKYKVTKNFEHILMCCDWRTVAPPLLEHLQLLFKKAEVEHELRKKNREGA